MCSRTVAAGSWLKLLATLQLSRNHVVETGGDKRKERGGLICPLSSLNRVCKKASLSAFFESLRLLDAFLTARFRLSAVHHPPAFPTQDKPPA